MAKRDKATCILCGVEYDVCKFCPATTQYTPWRRVCDTSRHYMIYHIVDGLMCETLTVEEAKEQLNNLKVTVDEVKGFVKGAQDILLPILDKQKSKLAPAVKKAESESVEG